MIESLGPLPSMIPSMRKEIIIDPLNHETKRKNGTTMSEYISFHTCPLRRDGEVKPEENTFLFIPFPWKDLDNNHEEKDIISYLKYTP